MRQAPPITFGEISTLPILKTAPPDCSSSSIQPSISHFKMRWRARKPAVSQAPTKKCRLLELPLELRREIYNHALFDSDIITIASAPVIGSCPDVLHHLAFTKRLLGLPKRHEPIVTRRYDPSLLSLRCPHMSLITTDGKSTFTKGSLNGLPTTGLLLANQQIHSEVMSEMAHLCASRRTSLFVSYPHGMHVLTRTCPHLLRRARSIHLSGTHDSSADGALHHRTLARLVCSILGPQPDFAVEKFEMRILYTGKDSYSKIWKDDHSPIVSALYNIAGGKIDVEVWRSKSNVTGVYLTASASPGRVVSLYWRDLPDRSAEDFVIDSNWPHWDAEYQTARPTAYSSKDHWVDF